MALFVGGQLTTEGYIRRSFVFLALVSFRCFKNLWYTPISEFWVGFG